MTLIEEAWRNISRSAHTNAAKKGFWDDFDKAMLALEGDPKTQEATRLAFMAQKLKLMGDELAEASEALRDGNPPSEKARGFSSLEEELGDIVIRLWDLEGKLKLNVIGAILAKMRYNAGRERLHGRKF